MRLIERGVWIPGAMKLTLHLWVRLMDEWRSTELEGGTRRGVRPGKDAFMPRRWARSYRGERGQSRGCIINTARRPRPTRIHSGALTRWNVRIQRSCWARR